MKKIAKKIISVWESIHNKSINSNAYCIGGDSYSNLSETNRKLKIAVAEDDSLISAIFVIESAFSEYISGAKITLKDYLNPDKQRLIFLSNIKEMNTLLSHGDVIQIKDEFYSNCNSMISHYQQTKNLSDSTKSYIQDYAIDSLFFAKSAFKYLSPYLIHDGVHGDITKLKFKEDIYLFDDMAHLANQSNSMPDGFCLSVIRANPISDSYFCLHVKSGSKTFLVADKPYEKNPFQMRSMASRNQRYNESRYSSSVFPYSILGIEFENNGRVAKESSNTALTNINAPDGVQILANISTLNTQDLLRLHFIFDECIQSLILDTETKFKKLAVITENSIKNSLTFVATSLEDLPVQYSDSITAKVQTVTSSELTHELLVKHCPGITSSSEDFSSLERLYAKKVADEVLYVPEFNYDTNFLLVEKGGSHSNYLPLEQEDNKNLAIRPNMLENFYIGDQKEIQARATYLARDNQARAIHLLAKEDFRQNSVKIEKQMNKMMAKNIPNIIEHLISFNHEELNRLNKTKFLTPRIQAFYVKADDRFFSSLHGHTEWAKAIKAINKNKSEVSCYLSRSKDVEFRFIVGIGKSSDLAILAGVEICDLPLELQAYRATESSSYMSDRPDPLTTITNPWDELKFSYNIPISKATVNKIRKKLGLSALTSLNVESESKKYFYEKEKKNTHSSGKIGIENVLSQIVKKEISPFKPDGFKVSCPNAFGFLTKKIV